MNLGAFSCRLQISVCSRKAVFFSWIQAHMSCGWECSKILGGTISLRGWIFSMCDGVIILAIFTCQPSVQNTRASRSCSNSSQRRFMTLCCRTASEFNQRAGTSIAGENMHENARLTQAFNLKSFISPAANVFLSSCCSLSTRANKHGNFLPVHKFNKSDMSDLWKQRNCPLRTRFQHQQGGWSVHSSPLQRLQCVWQMKKHNCRWICPEGWWVKWRFVFMSFFTSWRTRHHKNTRRCQARCHTNSFYTILLTFLMNRRFHSVNLRVCSQKPSQTKAASCQKTCKRLPKPEL